MTTPTPDPDVPQYPTYPHYPPAYPPVPPGYQALPPGYAPPPGYAVPPGYPAPPPGYVPPEYLHTAYPGHIAHTAAAGSNSLAKTFGGTIGIVLGLFVVVALCCGGCIGISALNDSGRSRSSY